VAAWNHVAALPHPPWPDRTISTARKEQNPPGPWNPGHPARQPGHRHTHALNQDQLRGSGCRRKPVTHHHEWSGLATCLSYCPEPGRDWGNSKAPCRSNGMRLPDTQEATAAYAKSADLRLLQAAVDDARMITPGKGAGPAAPTSPWPGETPESGAKGTRTPGLLHAMNHPDISRPGHMRPDQAIR